ncbi:glycosyltransferase [Mucilaginibacter sp.]|jgi:glycosyltransferase involved in cell wall biosynthesis|uniref:glycosyltransferase n=1 Tax=Mucilaginibacter sp. TaxID=1882438 RepID=UPI003569AA77
MELRQPVLSVLIATMPKRHWYLMVLLTSLTSQLKDITLPEQVPSKEPSLWGPGTAYNPPVEILVDASMDYNIGTKRNKLLERATGKYIVFVDDDDEVAPNYLKQICSATLQDADCIGISGLITTDSRNHRQWHISKEYRSWYERNGVYYRTPNHISPVKRELALQAGFPEISFGEDHGYSMRLLPLLKSEVTIPGNLYFYKYISNK